MTATTKTTKIRKAGGALQQKSAALKAMRGEKRAAFRE